MNLFDSCVTEICVEGASSRKEVPFYYIGGIVGNMSIQSNIKAMEVPMEKLGGTLTIKNAEVMYCGLFGAFYDRRGGATKSACTITDWYSEMNLSEASLDGYLGGFAGYHDTYMATTTINNGYIALDADITKSAGYNLEPIAGYNADKIAVGSLYLDTDKYIGVKPNPNYIGKTTKEMKKKETFTDWDFEDVWIIQENTDYPRFFLGEKRALITCKRVPLTNYRR